MFKNKNLIILIIGLIAVLIVAGFGYKSLKNNYTPKDNNPGIKKLATDFTIKDVTGRDFLLSDFRGKPVVLNFWASWCPPCREEMPGFNRVFMQYKDKNVEFVMVDLVDGMRETEEKAKNFIAESKFKFNIYFDIYNQASEAYRITSIPRTLFIDKNGYIVKEFNYGIDEKTLKDNVELLIK